MLIRFSAIKRGGSALPMVVCSPMMRLRKLSTVLFFVVLFIVGCEQRNPILVYVTPTPIPQIGAVSSPTPLSPTPVPQIGGDVRPTAVPTQLAPTVAVTLPPGATVIGPVIGPDYILPPTSTPRPTLTPTEGPTSTPGPTSTDAPPPTAGVQPTALPNLDPSRMGIQLDPNLDEQDWQDAVGRRADEDLMFGWIKVQVAWEDLQPNGPTDYGETFRRFEQYLQYADREGMNILLSVAKAPAWARSRWTTWCSSVIRWAASSRCKPFSMRRNEGKNSSSPERQRPPGTM